MIGLGLFGWLALIWVGSKLGIYGGKSGGGGDYGGPEPELGAETNRADGTVHKLANGDALLACAGKWWEIYENGICCAGASGTAVTISDGEQVVCAFIDDLSSYRWVRPGSQ